MKKYIVVLFILGCSTALFSQGVNFNKELNWQAVLAKAKTEQKFIFIDCFTTWCGPCKRMDQEVFQLREVGAAMNSGFINIKLQLDSTANDNEYVKNWRKAADSIAKAFKVVSYPTFIFLSPEGKLVHRLIGLTSSDKFIAEAKRAQNPKDQYYTMLHQALQDNNVDTALILHTAAMAKKNLDTENMVKLINKYLQLRVDPLSPRNILLRRSYMINTASPFFSFFVENKHQIDSVMGAGWSTGQRLDLILIERAYRFSPKTGHPDYDIIQDSIKKQFPVEATQAVALYKVQQHLWNREFPEFIKLLKEYMAAYPNGAGFPLICSFALQLAYHSKDPAELELVYTWLQPILRHSKTAQVLSTNGIILFKMGKLADGTKMMEEAISISEIEFITQQLQEILEKMKTGQFGFEAFLKMEQPYRLKSKGRIDSGKPNYYVFTAWI